jgi:hypothetical protein
MNCQDLNSVLDTHAPEQLGSAQRRDIEQHFASCQTCREAWAVYDELVATPIPETPRDLRRSIAVALEEQEPSDAIKARRSIIIGSLLVVGATVATTFTLGLGQHERYAPEPDQAC